MLRAAAGSADEICEARFYTGEWQLLRGDRKAAAALLQSAADVCRTDFVESAAARAELRRLNDKR